MKYNKRMWEMPGMLSNYHRRLQISVVIYLTMLYSVLWGNTCIVKRYYNIIYKPCLIPASISLLIGGYPSKNLGGYDFSYELKPWG
ncbi:hypothetical protein QTP88_022986 [Uroleucon formosanum]